MTEKTYGWILKCRCAQRRTAAGSLKFPLIIAAAAAASPKCQATLSLAFRPAGNNDDVPAACHVATDSMSMRVLLTGGAGFIGRHVLHELLARGHEVRVLDSLRPDVHGADSPRSLGGAELHIVDCVTPARLTGRWLERTRSSISRRRSASALTFTICPTTPDQMRSEPPCYLLAWRVPA